jgi:predicted NBD/HSP70 family sugar kinase
MELRQLLEKAVGLPVALENAASACALAELWFGRQADTVRHLVAVTVSEGVGVGLLVNGQVVHGRGAMAGEFGHVTLNEDGPLCACGKKGCWEQYASNLAAVRHYKELSRGSSRDPDPADARLGIGDILRLADEGCPHASAALARLAHYLGVGLASLVIGLAPEVVVIVGEVTAAWNRIGPVVLDTVKRRTLPANTTPIVPTDPATQPRLRGAVTLVVQEHFGAPNVA